jgi:transposase
MGAPTRNGINVPKWKVHQPIEPRGESPMKIATVGIDLAKNAFQPPESKISAGF